MLLLAAACGPEAPQPEPAGDWTHRGQPILGGTLAEEGEYPEVVLVESYSPGGGAFMCSGTLISRRVVLLAAHCLDIDELTPERVTVRFGENRMSGATREVVELRLHPDWDADRIRNDIALLRLERDPPADAVPVPALPAALQVTDADRGTALLFVGFGVNSWGSDGLKMWMHAPLDMVCTNLYGCHYAQQNTICIDQADTGICSGDSGGPAFIEREGIRYVAGVNSYTAEGCQYFGCATKVDAFETFIADFLGAPAGAACDRDEDCESWSCVDGVCCEADCDGRCHSCALPGQEGRCRPLPDGSDCADGNLCNGQEQCREGRCQAGQPLECADGVDCTKDLCDPATGCVFQPSSLACFDENPCTEDLCSIEQGCIHQPVADGSLCGARATCQAGLCQEPPAKSGCAHVPADGPSAAGLLGLLLSVGVMAHRSGRRWRHRRRR